MHCCSLCVAQLFSIKKTTSPLSPPRPKSKCSSVFHPLCQLTGKKKTRKELGTILLKSKVNIPSLFHLITNKLVNSPPPMTLVVRNSEITRVNIFQELDRNMYFKASKNMYKQASTLNTSTKLTGNRWCTS